MILLLEHGANRFLFTGDAELAAEEALVKYAVGTNYPGVNCIDKTHGNGLNVLFADGHLETPDIEAIPEETKGIWTHKSDD